MKKKKVLPYAKQILYYYTVNGLAWLAAGFLSLFDQKICIVMALFCVVVSLVSLSKYMLARKENADEMAIEHITKAMSQSFMIGHTAMIMFSILLDGVLVGIFSFSINWERYLSPIILMYVGVLDIIVGLIFNHLEKE